MVLKRFLTAAAAASVLVLSAMPASAQDWWNDDFAFRRVVTLNGAALKGVTEQLDRAPVLVRLHSGVLDFTQVKPDGSDLRFVGSDGRTPLTFHIERFDPLAELALVWVDVPKIAPVGMQEIWLYYGNPAAPLASNVAATYDGEFTLVAHLSENATVPVDVSAAANPMTAVNTHPTLEGLVAGGMTLAADSHIRAAPSKALHLPAGGSMTWSAWIKPAAGSAVADEALFAKLAAGGEDDPVRLFVGLRADVPYVALTSRAGDVAEASAASPLPEGTWAHVAVVAGEGSVTLYLNGLAAAMIEGDLPELGGDEIVGASGGRPGFVGDIDEINRSNTSRSADFIALQAQSQGRSAGLVTVASEGEAAGAAGEHDYFRILFDALTPDAWAVIILLTIMSVISWVIMVAKGQLFGRTASANRRFLVAYDKATRGQSAHSGLVGADLVDVYPASSVGRLFAIGQYELKERMAETPGALSGGPARYAIAPQSVAAIRAALDAGHIREERRLGRWMVLLTIAISGGPFLGLLGTVLGVMITFAGVAAAGEVNITAIAPGIAAALLATVAGLAVAIPALFGYNYLTSQLDAISDDNQVFVDELEKRIAETYRGGAAGPASSTQAA